MSVSQEKLVENPMPKVEMGKPVAEPSNKKLLVCFFGVFFSFLVYGFLQENITKSTYGEAKERFVYTLALVFVQCIVNALFAKTAQAVTTGKVEDTTPHSWYAAMTVCYVGAMLASNHSLQFVSYPTQVVGKSVKPIPVMLLGVLLARKRYPLQKYLFVAMIVAGVALFIYKDSKAAAAGDHVFGMGEMLLLLSLTLDGLTGVVQEHMRAEHRTSMYPMMINANVWSIFYLGIALLLTGEGVAFTAFAMRYPHVLLQMVAFSCCSAVGQNFIFMTVTTFGPLMCSIITTTRKFFTILGSVIIFQHPMLARQWLGTGLVFAGLGMDSVYGKEKKPPAPKST